MKINIATLAKCAVMVALATVLTFVKVYTLPNGGSITAASMVPIIIIALSSNVGVGLITALAFTAIQLITGFYPPPTQDILSFVLVILLDYVVAFGVLGLAGVIAKPFKNKVVGAGIATAIVTFVRFLCHFGSGILIWDVYAPPEQSVWLYSMVYNGSYMLIEGIISVIVIVFLVKALPKIFDLKAKKA